MLRLLYPLFEAGLGGRLGTGKQWLAWIALDDLLDIRRLEEGVIQLERRHCQADDLLRQTVSLMADAAARAKEHLEPAPALEAFGDCELIIEAAPERIELKHQLFSRLSEIVSTECVLGSNTSSLLVTANALRARPPARETA